MKLKYRVCSAMLAMIIILTVVNPGMYAFGEPSYVYGNTNSNLANYGLVCEYEGKVYFANSTDSNRLYTMKEDGTAYAKICDDEAQYINVVAGTVYYVNLSDNSTLYSVKADGTGRKQLSKDQCAYVNVVNDTIYYISITDGWKVKSCSLTGANGKVLNSSVTGYNLNVAGKNAYYISLSDSLIYRMDIATGKVTAISSAKAYQMVVYDNYVFYVNMDNSRVQRINADGAASQRIYTYTDYPCSHLAVHNGVVYFSMNEKQGMIGSLEIDDVYSDTDVSAIYGACLNATASYLYFAHIYENNGNFIYYGDMYRITYDGSKTQSLAELLQTETINCLTSSVYGIDHAAGVINGVKQQTAVASFVKDFSDKNGTRTVKIYDASGKELTEGSVGTGCEVRLLDGGEIIESLQVVLLGDVNGDGRISAMDLLQVQKHLLKLITLQDAYGIAADVNLDGRVSAMDLLQVQKHLLKMIVIA